MFAEYKRDVSHNYLILHGDETINTTSYQVRILTGNTMSSILKCRMQGLDGTWLFYYDITSKQSLASFYEQRKLQGEDLEMILKGFLHVIEEMAEFLLNTEQLVLCPEYIFLDVEKKEVSFCCLPDYHHPVQEQFRELTEYLLPKLDHEDPTAVNLGYGIYRKAMEPGMQLENIKELLYRSENSKEKIAESDTKIRDKEEYVEEMEEPPQFFQEEKKEKKDRKWQPAAGCAVGVLFLLGILIFRYLGYFPEIPIEVVLGAAILLMGVGAGWTWMEEKKKKKQEQSAEWRNKVQRELAGMNIEKHETERNNTERKEIKDIDNKVLYAEYKGKIVEIGKYVVKPVTITEITVNNNTIPTNIYDDTNINFNNLTVNVKKNNNDTATDLPFTNYENVSNGLAIYKYNADGDVLAQVTASDTYTHGLNYFVVALKSDTTVKSAPFKVTSDYDDITISASTNNAAKTSYNIDDNFDPTITKL